MLHIICESLMSVNDYLELAGEVGFEPTMPVLETGALVH